MNDEQDMTMVVMSERIAALETTVLALTGALSDVRINVLYGFTAAALAQIDAALEQASKAGGGA